MKIRLANKNDEPLIKEIHKQAHHEIGSFNTFQTWTNYLKGIGTYGYYIFDEIGFVRYGYSKKYSANILYDIAILNEYRGKGIGRKVMMKLPRPIILKCNIDNTKGNSFYKSIGMKLQGVVKSKNGKKEMNTWVLI